MRAEPAGGAAPCQRPQGTRGGRAPSRVHGTARAARREHDGAPREEALDRPRSRSRAVPYLAAGALVWTFTIGAFLTLGAQRSRREAVDLATAEARSAYQKDVLYRRWAAGHGGVYVPVSPDTPPNPYLSSPRRDVETRDGQRLTLVNPAYMTRQVHELGRTSTGLQGRITSLAPLRPENAPDPWERRALVALAAGAPEFREVADHGGAPHVRFMAPLVAETSCVGCHAAQGMRADALAGGLSVAAPLAPRLAAADAHLRSHAGWYALLWLLGLGAFGLAAATAWAREAERLAHAVAAREARERLAVALHGGGVGLWECDLATGALRWDDEVATPLPRPAEDVPDLARLQALVHPDDLPELRERDAAIRTGASEVLELEHRLLAADGSWRWLHVRGRIVERHPDGRPRRLAGSVADVTERRAAHEERARLERELGQARRLEALGQLAGGVAHDLNNLLSPILGNAAMALERLGPEDPIREELVDIREAAERARDLTRRLLAFGRRQPLAIEPIDAGALVSGLERMLSRLLPEGVRLAVRHGEDVPPARADRSQVELALVNLAVNARDAMPGGGVIRITTGAATVDGDRAAALGVAPGRYVTVAVSDDGCGMDEATRERAFEPFFTTKPAGHGTGLGLPSVHGLMRQLGGGIEVETAPGAGTTFTLMLPRAEAPPRTPAPVADDDVPRGTERLLVVEDDAGVRRYVSAALASLGYAVTVAASAGEALALAGAARGGVDLFVLDVVMPDATGPELAARLAALAPGARVLYMSGYPRDAFGGAAPPAGVEVLAKPFAPVDLGRAVRRALDGKLRPR